MRRRGRGRGRREATGVVVEKSARIRFSPRTNTHTHVLGTPHLALGCTQLILALRLVPGVLGLVEIHNPCGVHLSCPSSPRHCLTAPTHSRRHSRHARRLTRRVAYPPRSELLPRPLLYHHRAVEILGRHWPSTTRTRDHRQQRRGRVVATQILQTTSATPASDPPAIQSASCCHEGRLSGGMGTATKTLPSRYGRSQMASCARPRDVHHPYARRKVQNQSRSCTPNLEEQVGTVEGAAG